MLRQSLEEAEKAYRSKNNQVTSSGNNPLARNNEAAISQNNYYGGSSVLVDLDNNGRSLGGSSINQIHYRGFLMKRSNEPLSKSSLKQPTNRVKDVQKYSVVDKKFAKDSNGNQTSSYRTGIQNTNTNEEDFQINAFQDKGTMLRNQSIKELESFFGVSEVNEINTDNGKLDNVSKSINLQSDEMKTSKINISDTSNENSSDLHDMTQVPHGQSHESHPDDFISQDGHIWRAKFCIFAEGVLYFYENQEVADCMEAQKERDDDSSDHKRHDSSFDMLSKSPTPRSFLNVPTNTKNITKGVFWEKRVALQNVGACRSTVEEYGENSFVLLTHGSPENHISNTMDMLVLKAGSKEEMDEWMLQFQRSIESVMRKMILSVGSGKGFSFPNQFLNRKTFKNYPLAPESTSRSISSKTTSSNLPPFLSLSHGHGRNDLHRRILVSKDSVHSSMHSVLTSSTAPIPIQLESPSSNATSNNVRRLSDLTTTVPTNDRSRVIPMKKYVPPHLRKDSSSVGKKYIPPHLRNKSPLIQREIEVSTGTSLLQNNGINFEKEDERDNIDIPSNSCHAIMGGCAEVPSNINERRSKFKARSYSSLGGSSNSIMWEVGAISELGKRDSNEDAFVCAPKFASACGRNEEETDIDALFAIFDGHCGSSSAKFAANNIISFLEKSRKRIKDSLAENSDPTVAMERCLLETIKSLDHEICCKSEWESGSTAIMAMIVGTKVVLANLGDCRGVFCCTSSKPLDKSQWKTPDIRLGDHNESCYYREVTKTHSPLREDEKSRIEAGNGWVTREQEVCISQIQHVDLFDKDVVDILRRCFSGRLSGSCLSALDGNYGGTPTRPAPGRVFHTSRVCGELAVSRALGDKDFKGRYSKSTIIDGDDTWWEGPMFLPYPKDHNKCFKNDLVTSVPEIEIFSIGERNNREEFLILACDGLWDVMDPDDAVAVARNLLYTKKVSAEIAAARLAEIAIHLGSADNTTVLLVRFYNDD